MTNYKKVKRSTSRSFENDIKNDDEAFIHVRNNNDKSKYSATQNLSIYDINDISNIMDNFVADIAKSAFIDKDRFMKDLVEIFHKNKLIPLTIENPCLVCSKFIEHNSKSQLCGITKCNYSDYNPFTINNVDNDPTVKANIKVPLK